MIYIISPAYIHTLPTFYLWIKNPLWILYILGVTLDSVMKWNFSFQQILAQKHNPPPQVKLLLIHRSTAGCFSCVDDCRYHPSVWLAGALIELYKWSNNLPASVSSSCHNFAGHLPYFLEVVDWYCFDYIFYDSMFSRWKCVRSIILTIWWHFHYDYENILWTN